MLGLVDWALAGGGGWKAWGESERQSIVFIISSLRKVEFWTMCAPYFDLRKGLVSALEKFLPEFPKVMHAP